MELLPQLRSENGWWGEMNCAYCKYTDEMIYTSIPPQYKCTITGKFHFGADECDVEFKPVKHGRWIIRNERWHCSECDMQGFKFPYCPFCGADMREVENG